MRTFFLNKNAPQIVFFPERRVTIILIIALVITVSLSVGLIWSAYSSMLLGEYNSNGMYIDAGASLVFKAISIYLSYMLFQHNHIVKFSIICDHDGCSFWMGKTCRYCIPPERISMVCVCCGPCNMDISEDVFGVTVGIREYGIYLVIDCSPQFTREITLQTMVSDEAKNLCLNFHLANLYSRKGKDSIDCGQFPIVYLYGSKFKCKCTRIISDVVDVLNCKNIEVEP